jgi:hypothetical protein
MIILKVYTCTELNLIGFQETSWHNLNFSEKIFYRHRPKLILNWIWRGFISTYFCSHLYYIICTEYQIYGSFRKFWGRKEYSNIAKGWLEPALLICIARTCMHPHTGIVHSLLIPKKYISVEYDIHKISSVM